MPKLSVNINKVATIRNARGGNIPDVIKFAIDCERYGAQGITVHPRPDGRHIRYNDVKELKNVITTELNVEGYPSKDFIALLLEVKPHQATLVPDAPDVLTSNAGWNVKERLNFLVPIIASLQQAGIRTSLFVDADDNQITAAKKTGTDRIELYTEQYAEQYEKNAESAIHPFILAAQKAIELNIGLNAGHDLNLSNLKFFSSQIPNLLEVSIGHALISDALYFGIENTIQMYLRKLVE